MFKRPSNNRILLLLVTPLLLAAPVFAHEHQPATQGNEATTLDQSAAIASSASLTKRDGASPGSPAPVVLNCGHVYQ